MPPPRSRRTKLAAALLVVPLLLGCGCCELPGAVVQGVFGDDRPVIAPEQVPGVWESSCGGRVTFRDDGTYSADGLMSGDPLRPVSAAGRWDLQEFGDGEQLVELSGFGPFLYASRADEFEGLEYDARQDVDDPHHCRLRRP